MRFQGNMSISFGEECIFTIRHLINRTLPSKPNGKSSYEMLHGKTHVYEHLRVFRSLCYVHTEKEKSEINLLSKVKYVLSLEIIMVTRTKVT